MKLQQNTKPLFVMVTCLFAVLLSACAASPTPDRVFTVGIISGTQTNSVNTLGQSFKTALLALGYTEGKTLKFIDKGVLTKADTLAAGLNDLITAKVDAMLVLGTTAATAAKKATADNGIPVVFAPGGDPVDLGLVQSLTNPGGNMTGLKTGFFYPSESIQYMQQINPNLKHVLVIYDPTGQGNKFIPTLNDTGTKLNIEIVLKTVSSDADVTAAFASIPDNIDAVLNIPDNAVNARIKDLIAATLKRNIPLITVDETTLAAGALLSYAWNPDAMAKQVAQTTNQILKGTKPGTIPIQAGEFYIGVNLKTAQALNITIPDSVLKQATTIIR
jgi:putative ABC transport system substrate-binding protein